MGLRPPPAPPTRTLTAIAEQMVRQRTGLSSLGTSSAEASAAFLAMLGPRPSRLEAIVGDYVESRIDVGTLEREIGELLEHQAEDLPAEDTPAERQLARLERERADHFV